MAKEAKFGLLLGLAIILGIGLFVSDHLTWTENAPTPSMEEFGAEANRGLGTEFHQNQDESEGRLITPGPTGNRTQGSQRESLAQTPILPDPNQRQVESEGGAPRQSFEEYMDSLNRASRGVGLSPSRGAVTPPAVRPVIPPVNPQVDPFARRHPENVTPAGRIDSQGASQGEFQLSVRGIEHRVQIGDNLYGLAEQYLGDGNKWRLIRDANSDTVTPDGHIVEGALLLIPIQHAAGRPTILQQQQSTRRESSPEATIAAGTITVREGDTLSSLAAQHLGSASRWRELYEFNRLVVPNADYVPAGVALRLPSDTVRRSPDASSPSRAGSPARGSSTTYRIAAGDNLSDLAARFLGDANRWRDLHQANSRIITNPDVLPVGKSIVIPQ